MHAPALRLRFLLIERDFMGGRREMARARTQPLRQLAERDSYINFFSACASALSAIYNSPSSFPHRIEYLPCGGKCVREGFHGGWDGSGE